MKHFLLAVTAIFFAINLNFAQELEKKWQIEAVKNDAGVNLYDIDSSDEFQLKNGNFNYDIKSADSLGEFSGNYLFQNTLLVLYYDTPTEKTERFNISELTDSTLVFANKEMSFSFKTPSKSSAPLMADGVNEGIVPSQGFSLGSLWRGLLGMVSLIFIAFLFSSNRKAINWKTVGIGLAFQLIIAVGVLKVEFIKSAFEVVGKGFIAILGFTQAGSEFLFGGILNVNSFGYIFAFQVLPTIIFFSALTSVLFYLGVIQKVVKGMGWLLSRVLGISGAESLSVAGNIFLGQTEAPLLIKAYLEKMNKSEILLVMIGGMATVAGAVLAAYIGFLGGEDEALQLFYAKHLLAASVMAAPGAIVISKILYPQTEPVDTDVHVSQEKIGSNILEAIANGTTEGLKLAVNVGAMLLVFVAFIAMFNGIIGGIASFDGFTIGVLNIDWHFTSLNQVIADNTPYDSLSLEFILGYLFAPLMWLIGIAREDMALMGQLLGIKLAASEFIGYIQLSDLKNVANPIHLKYEKSVIMATYMLCGFANFASIGIQIGGIGSLAPGQRKTLSKFGMKALIGGTIASLISATIAGMIIG
ncbi:Na+ dependent nucleoside transporter [Subsaximicrobium wynnwilliamsii]|uniref:Na+ dependent nucleoside transporter n=1 Tax=Subsaximicrobium wynnwilliamsii TaxID=291179 RepID=A0A5C6ZKU3_9FLAO|nr:nucleoside transporter C-terminal domain-containing protein [Subsaximicrobium wynnwilliamsii]TXD85504.1 Na+ dependent nucleoside transporter [Subsaximicrobium wynnwilliamsii]TXD90857.1 Na+ dependent nucleoside transporter [Subsaximicrobium wynnwilliamsii]TXE05364.1 Na+ dependent nucleoside transporter [Subsaximicrobium wynnwilliamsii]